MKTSSFDMFKWLAGKEEAALATSIGQTLTENNFKVAHTGGGCLAWEKLSNDDKHYALICDLDNDLGTDADPETAGWLVGFYDNDGDVADGEIIGLDAAMAWCDKHLNGTG